MLGQAFGLMSAKSVRQMSVVEAKARFSEVLREVEAGWIVVIHRHGRDVAAVVSPGDFERLRRLQAAGPERGLASIAGGGKGCEDLADRIDAVRRSARRLRYRTSRRVSFRA
jgi:prevent-host-death family protein